MTAPGMTATVGAPITFTVRKGGGIAIRIKRNATVQGIQVVVVTGPYSKPRTLHTDTGTYPVPVGQWYDMVLPAAFLTRYSDPGVDMNWCIELQIKAIPAAGQAATLEFAEPRVIQGDGAPRVIWAFDDGRADQYSVAYPILKAAGYTGTIAVEWTNVGAVNRCTLDQYKELYAAGWEFIGHHTTQITSLSDADAETVFRGAREWAQNNGFLRGTSHWVWPGGQTDPQKDMIASRYFLTRRKVSPMVNNIIPGVYDPCDTPVYYITQTRPLADAQAYIDRVAANGNTAHFAFHSLTTGTPTAPEDWTVSDFQALVAYAKSKGLSSTSFDETFGISG
ncbi:polysaccharide deacetylase family protein [Arthrobacter sp. NPDC080031]|uniref:polysaccharide deacetylase family protein n=1 Tax=Arthrobacter sp. NPDC080031 TaxID=3155918 RepID=UPI00344D4CC1